MDQITEVPVVARSSALPGDIPDVLARIMAEKAVEVRERALETPRAEIEAMAKAAPRPRDFTGALCAAVGDGITGLIAEIKRASPSGGTIREDLDPGAVARIYCDSKAACLSVLTDATWFGGRPGDLRAARENCHLPVLRKDFLFDPWQVFESRAMGADCVLLIMAALSDAQANELEDVARSLDMSVLAEVHDERELERALALETRLIGVNNRDLRALRTDLAISDRLIPMVPADRIPVAESGIRTPDDVHRMAAAGARCLLVGEHLLRQPDIGAATRALVEAR